MSFDGDGATAGVPADVSGQIDGSGMCAVTIPGGSGMTPAGGDRSFRGWSTVAGATAADSQYDPGEHQYSTSTVPSDPVKLYAVWRTTPAPIDLNVAYHSDSDTVAVTGQADDLDDHDGVVTVCANSSSSDACTPSDIHVTSVTADLNDSGRLAIRATANRLRGDATWAGALVCPAGTPFPTFQDGQPANTSCSNIEILTGGKSGGWSSSDGFSIGGRFSWPGNSDYTTVDSDFKGGAGSYDVWMFTRSRLFDAMGTPLRVLAGYQYTATRTLSEPSPKKAAVNAVSMRSAPIISRAQSLRIKGTGSGQTWKVAYSAADFSDWYQRDTPYYIAARLTLDSGGFTTSATSETVRKSDVLPWLEVKFDVNADNGGSGTAPDSVYGFIDEGRSMVTLPGKDSMPGAIGKLTGWSMTAKPSSSPPDIYAVGKQAIPAEGGTSSPSGKGTVVTLYAIWGIVPKPYDLKVAYHRSTETVDVTGEVDTGSDTDGIVSVCLTDKVNDQNACADTSGVRVDKIRVDPDDRGRIAITGTADSLNNNKQGTWIQALVCPAGADFPTFPAGGLSSQPSNQYCSNIEMLTDNHSNGIRDGKNGFSINGHFGSPSDPTWTTSNADFKVGHGRYDIWIYQRDAFFNIIGSKTKLISNYGYGVPGDDMSGADNMYVQLHGTGVQHWTISYPVETFTSKFPIGSEHHLIVRLNVGDAISDPANADGTLPWLKATFNVNAGHGGSGTPPDGLSALVDDDEKNALVTLPGQGDGMNPDHATFVGWNRQDSATGVGKDDVRPGQTLANDMTGGAKAYLDQAVDQGVGKTETDVTLYAIWDGPDSALPFTGGPWKLEAILVTLLGGALSMVALTNRLRHRSAQNSASGR